MGLSTGRPSKKREPKLTNEKIKINRVNFNLEEYKHIELKKYAINHGKTVTEVLTEMIDAHIIQR